MLSKTLVPGPRWPSWHREYPKVCLSCSDASGGELLPAGYRMIEPFARLRSLPSFKLKDRPVLE